MGEGGGDRVVLFVLGGVVFDGVGYAAWIALTLRQGLAALSHGEEGGIWLVFSGRR